MATEIKLIVDGRELIVEASSEHLSAVKAAGTRFMNQHEATAGFFAFDGVNYVRHQGERQWHATMAVDVAADIDVDRKDAAAEKEPATVEAVLDIVLDGKAAPKEDLVAVPEMDARFDELPSALEADYTDVVVTRNDAYRLHSISPDSVVGTERPMVDGSKVGRLAKAVWSAVSWCAALQMVGMVTVRDGRNRPVAVVSGADGVLVSKSLVKPDAPSVRVSSAMSCVATFKKALASAIVVLGTAFYALTAPAPTQACGEWDVEPATHQEVLGDGFREHFAYTLPNGEYVEAVGDLLPDRIQCDRALDEDLVKLEAELENARHEAGTVILEKVIGSCEYEQVLDAPRRTARRAR